MPTESALHTKWEDVFYVVKVSCSFPAAGDVQL